jgi:hypothetical protein
MQRFSARLEPIPHGGCFVVVPAEVVERAGVAYGMRVRGTVERVPYRSSLAKYSGVFHLGIPKASLAEVGAVQGDTVKLSLEPDPEPLPTDLVPADLRAALAAKPAAAATWAKLAPGQRRGFVKTVLDAKRAETRARRISALVATLKDGVPPRRTWAPKAR